MGMYSLNREDMNVFILIQAAPLYPIVLQVHPTPHTRRQYTKCTVACNLIIKLSLIHQIHIYVQKCMIQFYFQKVWDFNVYVIQLIDIISFFVDALFCLTVYNRFIVI